MASPNSLKRTYAEAGLEDALSARAPSSPFSLLTAPSPMAITQYHAASQASPPTSANPAHLPMPNGSPTVMPSGPVPTDGASASPTKQPAKKAKLAFTEKEARRVEKEFKDREREEEKARKEAEKARKDGEKAKKEGERAKKEAEKEAEKAKREEEKKLKDAEKEEKRRAKEETARLKQEDKARREAEKEEDKIKKESSQLRLHKFFAMPSMPTSSSADSPSRDGPSPLSSRRSSIAEVNAMDTMEAQRRSRSVSSTPQKPRLPDYERCFLAFELPTHSIMALSNRFSRDKDGRAYVEAKIDEGLEVEVEPSNAAVVRKTAFNSCELLHIFPHYRHLHLPLVISVKSLVGQIRGTPQNLIDRKESQFANATQKPMELLKMVPVKSLKFAEDVRPPYVGTYTRLQDGLSISQLARNPFSRTLPETNYDYDSEAEWEEPGEGEDLDSEGEEELGDDEDEAEMDGFLDDEEAIDARRIKRRPLLGDLEPTCTGLCWEGPKTPTAKNGAFALDLLMFKLDILMDNPQLPIDPYSTTYWKPTASTTPLKLSTNAQTNLMDPPRIPLNPVNRQNTLHSPSSAQPSGIAGSAPMKPPKPHKRLIAPELMDEFKAAVQGNDLTKVGLLEILKKHFPKMPKDAIRETLDLVAERVGPKSSEKKWVLKPGF